MITAYVVGDAEVVARLKSLPAKIQTTLSKAVTRLAVDLTSKVKTDKLSGQALKRRTGTLSRSINYRVNESTQEITAQVGTNVEYAALHEYGFKGTEQVKEHLRTIKQAFGKPIDPRSVTVAAHSRRVDYPERSFLRSSLREMEQAIRIGLADAVHEAVQQ